MKAVALTTSPKVSPAFAMLALRLFSTDWVCWVLSPQLAGCPLAAGVTGTLGRFESGDTVSVLSPDGIEVARGIAAYSDNDASRIMGRRSSEIEAILGFRGREELIHRDDLVILQHDYRPPEHKRAQPGASGSVAEVKP